MLAPSSASASMPAAASAPNARRPVTAGAAAAAARCRGGRVRAGGPPRCIDLIGRSPRLVAARALSPSRGSGAAPDAPSPSPSSWAAAPRPSAAAAAAAAASAARTAPLPPVVPDDIAVTGVAASFASYEDPADAGRASLLAAAAPPPLPLPLPLQAEAAVLEALLSQLRACGSDAQARLAVLESHPRVVAMREATR